jgi:YHS domain-containing protein
MRHLILTLLLFTACGAVVLAAPEKPGDADSAKKDPSKPVNKFCPIEKENEVDPKVTTTYEGKVVAFCCADCIDKFKADPKKYMKDLK